MIHIFSTVTKDWQPLLDITTPLWMEYANRHGYQADVAFVDPEFPEHYSFTKTAAVARKAAGLNQGDALFVIDMDMIPTNLHYDLEMTIVRGSGRGPGTIAMGKDINGWNSGAYFVTCHPMNLAWLDCIVNMRSVCTSEQHAMWLINEPFGMAEAESINSIPYEAYEGFNFEKKDHYSQWEPGHFICHLPGMTMEDRILLLQQYIPKVIR